MTKPPPSKCREPPRLQPTLARDRFVSVSVALRSQPRSPAPPRLSPQPGARHRALPGLGDPGTGFGPWLDKPSKPHPCLQPRTREAEPRGEPRLSPGPRGPREQRPLNHREAPDSSRSHWSCSGSPKGSFPSKPWEPWPRAWAGRASPRWEASSKQSLSALLGRGQRQRGKSHSPALPTTAPLPDPRLPGGGTGRGGELQPQGAGGDGDAGKSIHQLLVNQSCWHGTSRGAPRHFAACCVLGADPMSPRRLPPSPG